MTNSDSDNNAKLIKEISRTAAALEKQNNPGARFILGIVFGVGTAIGASIIASLVLFGSAKVLQMVGFDLDAFTNSPAGVVGE